MNFNNEFWQKIYKENSHKIIGVLRRYVKNKEVAEDLMHETFITAINKSYTYTGKGRFEAWLRKIAVNMALMYLRKQKSQKNIDDLIESDFSHEDTYEVHNIKNIIFQAEFTDIELLEVIDSLPEQYRLIFNLYVIDGYTHIQIAKELNISPGTSKSYLARARKKIQQLLLKKALEKNQEQTKKKKSLLLLFLPFGYNYVDVIFKNKLANISFEPKKTFSIFDTLTFKEINILKTKALFSNKIILNAIFGIIFVSGFFYYKSSLTKTNNITSKPSKAILTDTLTEKLDTIRFKKQHQETLKINETKLLKYNKPVIIKQKIIQRKTIVIRDTIKVIEKSNVQ